MGPISPRCQPMAGTLACAGRSPAYMLVDLNGPIGLCGKLCTFVYLFINPKYEPIVYRKIPLVVLIKFHLHLP